MSVMHGRWQRLPRLATTLSPACCAHVRACVLHAYCMRTACVLHACYEAAAVPPFPSQNSPRLHSQASSTHTPGRILSFFLL